MPDFDAPSAFSAIADAREDARQLAKFRSNPPHFLTVSAKD